MNAALILILVGLGYIGSENPELLQSAKAKTVDQITVSTDAETKVTTITAFGKSVDTVITDLDYTKLND